MIQTLGTAYAFMQWEPQTNAIGFGCYPQGVNRVEISENWDLYVKGKKFEPNESINGQVEGDLRVTGDLWLKGDGNYGNTIHFGDKNSNGQGYARISEPSDDILSLNARIIQLLPTSGANGVTINGAPVPSFLQASQDSFKTGTYFPVYRDGAWVLLSTQDVWNILGDG